MENLKLDIVELPITRLKLRKSNPRTHSKQQIRKIADSIRDFEEHRRVEAAMSGNDDSLLIDQYRPHKAEFPDGPTLG